MKSFANKVENILNKIKIKKSLSYLFVFVFFIPFVIISSFFVLMLAILQVLNYYNVKTLLEAVMNIGERIKTRRKELGMSAEQIADIIGTSPATIYRYESNYITKMGVDKLTPIAKALHVSEAYLMGWTDDVSWLPNDEKLLSVIHQLSLEAQEKVLEYAEDLLASKRYSR